MENKENNTREYFVEEREADDTFSFCNLAMQEYNESPVMQSPRDSSAQDLFEFFNEQNPEFYSPSDIIFCGKMMHEDEDNKQNEYQKRDNLAMVKSHSFRRPSNYYDEHPFFPDEKDLSRAKKYSSSSRWISSSNYYTRPDSAYRVQKVNITSLTSMSAKSRRRMFMFGPVKFKPEMDLSAIKERQGRISPKMMMFPAQVEDGGKVVVSGGGKPPGGKKSHWNMVRLLRGKEHLTAVLARSFGCIPAASVGQWTKVAN